jgi:hypothetical protein
MLDFALRLPGFTLPIMKYWDGQGLRYVHFFSLFISHLFYMSFPSHLVPTSLLVEVPKPRKMHPPNPSFLLLTGKSKSAHTRSDMCLKTAPPTKYFLSSFLHCI